VRAGGLAGAVRNERVAGRTDGSLRVASPSEHTTIDGAQWYKMTGAREVVRSRGGIRELDGGEGAIVR